MIFHGKECLTDDFQRGNPFREDYVKGICSFIERERASAKRERNAWASPREMARNRESYRERFLSMIGSPAFPKELPAAETEEIGRDGFGTVYRMQIEVLPDVRFYGILSLPFGKEKMPLILAQHGGAGIPELCSDLCGENHYSHFTKRALEDGFAVFAPSLALWNKEEAVTDFPCVNVDYDRQEWDKQLKQLGFSITGLEVFFLRRVLDYFCGQDYIISGQVGMTGVSYGGYFSLYTAAADTRIKSIYAAAFFNDRDKELFPDWGYFGAARHFFDAETVGLCAPRKVFLDVGTADAVFDYHGAVTEAQRAKTFYEAAGAAENFSFHLWDGGHVFDENSGRFSEFFRAVKGVIV